MLNEAVKQDFVLFQAQLAGKILSEVVCSVSSLILNFSFFIPSFCYTCVAFVCKLTIIIINNCHNLCVINLIMHCFGYPFSAVCIFDALA